MYDFELLNKNTTESFAEYYDSDTNSWISLGVKSANESAYPIPEWWRDFASAQHNNGFYLFGGNGKFMGPKWKPLKENFYFDFDRNDIRLMGADEKPAPRMDIVNKHSNEWMHDGHVGNNLPEGEGPHYMLHSHAHLCLEQTAWNDTTIKTRVFKNKF